MVRPVSTRVANAPPRRHHDVPRLAHRSPVTDERDALLDEQRAYYRARAAEYDQWWFREGRYDRGPELNTRWFSEVEALERALDEFQPGGDVLELAPGTGLWTRHLVR